MSDMEQCRPCVEGAFKVSPDDNVPLCNGHWNAFLARYLGADDQPCRAHRIKSEL